MHWNLRDLYALPPLVYLELVMWLTEQQKSKTDPES